MFRKGNSQSLIILLATAITATTLLTSITSLKAQKLDSLLRILPQEKEDTHKVIILENIAYYIIFKDRSKQPPFIDQMIQLSHKLGYTRGIAKGYAAYADYYISMNRLSDADTCITKSLQYYNRANDQKGLALIYGLQGGFYKLKGDYEKALISMQMSYNYYEKIGHKEGQALRLGSMATLFIYLERYDEAETYALRSLEICKEIGDKRGMALNLLDLGSIQVYNKNYDKALMYYNLCLELAKELDDLIVITNAKSSIAEIYLLQGKFTQALSLSEECYTNYGLMGDTAMMGMQKVSESKAYRKLGNPKQALTSMKQADAIIKNYDMDPLELGDYYLEYTEVYQALGKYKEALESYKKAIEYRSDNFSTETANKISELKEKYETEKKEQENIALKNTREIQTLRLQRQWYFIYGLAGILLLLVIISVLLIRTNRIVAAQKNMRLEQRLLRSQMNPHFVFNALIAIQSYLFKSDPKSAGKFLSSFAKLMRGILENSREEYITVAKEVQWLENYVELQKLRFDNRFNYTITIDENIDQENILIPPMLTQPFIENALEHGLGKKESMGQLDIHLQLKNRELSIQVSDDGVGFDQQNTKTDEGTHRSLAIQITKERLQLLNKRKRKKIHFEIASQLAKGTTVSFSIPVKTKL